MRRAAGAPGHVDDEDDGKFEPFGRVDGHQVHGVERLEHRIRLVAGGQRVDVIGDARQRRVAAVLDAPDEPAHLLQVLPRLLPARSAQLVGVGGLRQELFDQVRRRDAIDLREPSPERWRT